MNETLTTIIQKFFAENDWQYDYDEKLSCFISGVQSKNYYYRFFIVPDATTQIFSLRMSSNFYVPVPYRREVVEYLARVNDDQSICYLKMDLSDGEVTMDIAADFEDSLLTPKMVLDAVLTCAISLDQYLPGIHAVVEQGKTALVAYSEIAHDDKDEDDEKEEEEEDDYTGSL